METRVRRPLVGVIAALGLLLAPAGCGTASPSPRSLAPPAATPAGTPSADPTPSPTPSPSPTLAPTELPLGGRTIFPRYRVVAYYGTAGNPVLGVLGEAGPDAIMPRLRTTAAKFASRGRTVQVAYELIVTVALASPGPDGDYSRRIDLDKVQQYVDAARRNKALIVLDVQPGRSDFLSEVKPLRRFLEQPHVGLALDPEWRVGPTQVPAKVIGSVRAAEVNAVSAYVADIVRERNLPEKLFLLHQFRASMIPDIAAVKKRAGLAMVQHIDGFGTRSQKDATFERLCRPRQFHVGYKLFYDEDVRLYAPADVLRFKPVPEYVSYQ